MKKIYIHIGWHKTGSTAIQQFLLKNKQKLIDKEKIYYPSEGLLTCAHHTIAWLFQGKKKSVWGVVETPEGGAKKLIENIRCSMDSQGCETVIISSEEFCTFNKSEIKALHEAIELNNFNVQIIAYIRRQDQLIESAYNMGVKWWGVRETRSFSDYVKSKNPYIKYIPEIESWAGAFGQKNIIIREFSHEKLIGNDVVVDFCSALNIDWHYLDVVNKKINDSLDNKAIEFLRVLNNLHIPNKTNNLIVLKLFEYRKIKKSPNCILFTPDERIKFMARLNDSNKLLEKFCKDIDFLLPPRELIEQSNVKPLELEEFNEIFKYIFTDNNEKMKVKTNKIERVKRLFSKLETLRHLFP